MQKKKLTTISILIGFYDNFLIIYDVSLFGKKEL